jgi:hypothetical protein
VQTGLVKQWRTIAHLLLGLLVLSGPSLAAQVGHSSPFTPDELARFAKADQAVQQVRLRYLDVLAKDEKEGRDMKWSKAAMQIDMGKAIKATGLTLDTYNQIAHAMATDSHLRRRIDQLEKH